MQDLNGKQIVFTGEVGFIGSHLSEELVRYNCRVIILDNLFTGEIENISPLINGQRIEFIHGSVTDLPLLHLLFSGVDYVFHLAAIPGLPRSIDNPVASHEVNVNGTLNVLIAAHDKGVKKVVYASSSAIYGDTRALFNKESMLPSPQVPHAVNKLASEYYCRVFDINYQLPMICLRYFNVFGPRQDPCSEYSAVIPKFIQRISQNKPPIIFGDGEQSQDSVFVKDVVSANLLAAASEATGLFNVGTGEKTTLNQLVQVILKLKTRDDLKPIY